MPRKPLSPEALDLLVLAAQPGGVLAPPYGDPRRTALTLGDYAVVRGVVDLGALDDMGRVVRKGGVVDQLFATEKGRRLVARRAARRAA